LQLILEVYQFARDAAVAEAWLIAQDPYLKSEEFGHSIDEVENLIKKHEAFEKAAAAQEERFAALERLTTFELKDMKRRQDEEQMRQQDIIEKQKAEQDRGRQGHDQTDTKSDTSSIKESTVVPEHRKVKPSFKPPVSGRPVSEVKTSPSTPPGATPEPQTPKESTDAELAGMLTRKHEWESTTKKASNRSWDKICVVLKGTQIIFYKDQKTYRTRPEETFRSELPVDLVGGVAEVAADYTEKKKKKHVFRLRLANGGDYLFEAADDEQMNVWVNTINQAAQAHEEGPGKSQTLPPGSERKDEPKRRSFFTLKKK